MTLGELKDVLRNTSENDIFDFSPSARSSILSFLENWEQDWTYLFKIILKRIKTKKGYKDAKNKEGMYIPLPLSKNSKKFMVIYYKKPYSPNSPNKERYLIYDFNIVNTNKLEKGVKP